MIATWQVDCHGERAGQTMSGLRDAVAQAEAVLKAAEQGPVRMLAYIVVSLLTGAHRGDAR
jgi:hypothetical protein